MLRDIGTPRQIKVQTIQMPSKLTDLENNESARGISLYYMNKRFVCQTFFAKPNIGEINLVEGLETNADVYIRSILLIGPNLYQVRCVGAETQVHTMCRDDQFFNMLRGISTTLNEKVRSRRYLETTSRKDTWNVIVSLERKLHYIADTVLLNGRKIHISNIIILGDRLLGLTDKHEVVMGQLTPDIFDRTEMTLTVNLMEEVNKLGTIDLLTMVPNSEDYFLCTIQNKIYQFNLWGELHQFNILEDEVKKINSINFNNTRTILATTNGLYEMDVMEMPNMVRATSLPRQVANPYLRKSFDLALYVEDPYILGVHPSVGIFAKTHDDKVVFF